MSDYWQTAKKIREDYVEEEKDKLLNRFYDWFGDYVPCTKIGKNYNDDPVIEFAYIDGHTTYDMIAEWADRQTQTPNITTGSLVSFTSNMVSGWEIRVKVADGSSVWGAVTDEDNAISELFALCDSGVQRQRADEERRKAVIVPMLIDKQNNTSWLERLVRKDAI